LVNRTEQLSLALPLIVIAAFLIVAAWLRGSEYDEQYTMFLIAGVARPIWPEEVFPAGLAATLQSGQASLLGIASDLRVTDVHPPLYFWAAALWRQLMGGGLFTLRLLSVACTVVSLALVGRIARAAAAPPLLAVVLTAGCYGFAYTGVIARGFALAQMLSLAGALAVLGCRGPGRALVAGLLFGAAAFSNYLAVFPAAGIIAGWVWEVLRNHRSCHGRPKSALPGVAWDGLPADLFPAGTTQRDPAWSGRSALTLPFVAVCGAAPFLLAAFWFFVEQRESRIGQFPPFDMVASLARLGQYGTAAMFGGLPLYLHGSPRIFVYSLVVLSMIGCVVLVMWRHRAPPFRPALVLGCCATPAGLLVLGLIFDNTPIELRYLAFMTPYVSLLLAGAMGDLPCPARTVAAATVIGIQVVATAAMPVRQETMQPAQATAAAAGMLAGDGAVLLPRGNDGVGIVGAFATEARADLPILVISAGERQHQLAERLAGLSRVVVATLTQDQDSRTAVPATVAALMQSGWQRVAEGYNVIAFERHPKRE